MASKIDEILEIVESTAGLKKNKKKCNALTWILVIIGALAVVGAVAYAIYYFFIPQDLDDLDEDLEDDFEDDFFDEEEDESQIVIPKSEDEDEETEEPIQVAAPEDSTEE